MSSIVRSKSSALRLVGAKLLRDGDLHAAPLTVEDGCFGAGTASGNDVDLTGYLLLPGIVDLHGDAFERHVLPRPRAAFSLDQALVATDREAAANGVCTAWLAQSWSWEGGHRSPEAAVALLDAISAYKPRMQTDLRVQIRCETHTTDTLDQLLLAVERYGVDYVVFNNHLDEALQQLELDKDDLTYWARSVGRSLEDYIEVIKRAGRHRAAVPRYLCSLAAAFDRKGVLYGSHDDKDAETRETYSMIGAKICEFPLNRTVAKVARSVGDPVIMGAPNVVRGGSQSGNVAAQDLIAAGYCNALVSDYYYPALAKAAFKLSDLGILPFAEAWALISGNPARIMRLADRGSLAEGKRADLVIVNEATRDIEATLVAGRVSHMSGGAAGRFLRGGAPLAIAAE